MAKNISLAEKRRLAHETDLQRMAGLLMQHRHDQAGFTRYGNFDVFHQFLQEETRLPQIMTEVLDIEPKTSRVPVIKVVSLGCTRILLGKEYIANVAEILQDPHVARQLDLAAEEAIHPDTYANLLAHANFNAQARLKIERQHLVRLEEKGYLRWSGDGLYAVDTTYIALPPQFAVPEVYNYRTKKKGKYLKVGFLVQLNREGPHIIICAVVTLGNVDDRDILTALLEQADQLLPPGAIKILLLDRGFYDGEFLYKLRSERQQMDFIIPPENICGYVQTAKAETQGYETVVQGKRTHRIATLEQVTDVPGYPEPLTLVLDDQRSEQARRKETASVVEGLSTPPGWASSQPVAEPTPRQVLQGLSVKQLRAVVQQGKGELRSRYQVRLARLKRPSKVQAVRAERDAQLQLLNQVPNQKAALVELLVNQLAETRACKLALQMRRPSRKPRAKLTANERQIHTYLTSLSKKKTLAIQDGLEIIETYHQRIQIDNAVIKMLKTYLTLENWPSHNLEAVANHVLMVCLMFNVIGLFKSQRGRSYTGKSIAKLRSEFLGVLAIAIYAGSEYAILTLEEFVEVVARSVGIQLDAGTFT
jgi:hypothetical protein